MIPAMTRAGFRPKLVWLQFSHLSSVVIIPYYFVVDRMCSAIYII